MKRRQSILSVFYIGFPFFIIVLIVLGLTFGRLTENQLEQNLAENYKQEQSAIAAQTTSELKRQIDTVKEKLQLISTIEGIQSTNPKVCNPEVERVIDAIGLSLGNLARLNEQGIFYCSVNKKIIGLPGEKFGSYITDIFKDPNHAPVMGRMILPPGSDGYVLGLHVPVYNKDKRFIGTLGGAISTKKLASDYLSKIKFAKKGFVTVFDDNGDIIYNIDPTLIGKNRHSEELQKLTRNNEQLNKSFKDALAGSISEARYFVGEEERLAVIRSIEILPGRRWVVNGVIPVKEIENSSENLGVNRSILLLNVAYNTTIFLAAVGLFIFIRWRIFRPIKELNSATNIIQSGDMDAHVNYVSKDELGQLALAFNNMTSRLKNYYSELELKVTLATTGLTRQIAKNEEQIKVQEDTKRAITNILEDLQEEKLKLSAVTQKDEALVSSIGDSIVVTDEFGNIDKVNPETEKLLGYSEAKLLGKNVSSTLLITGKDGKQVAQEESAIFRALASGETTHDVYQLKRKDKSVVFADFTASPYLIDGNPAGAVVIIRDVSQQAAIDKAKTEFVSLASHQLRTPLSTINWYLEMVLGGDAGKISLEQKKYLTEIYSANQRMVVLVNSLLNVSRIDLGTFAIEPVPTDLKETVGNVVSELQGQIQQKKMKIVTNFDEKLELYNADPKLIHIIFQNLISNSVKYTPEKGTITITIEPKAPNILISVADNGFGIPKAQQAKIFTKLFRADNVISKDTDGTGLGLYLLRAIVEEAGGKIGFTSRENEGTTFTIHLPLSGMKPREGTRGLSSVSA